MRDLRRDAAVAVAMLVVGGCTFACSEDSSDTSRDTPSESVSLSADDRVAPEGLPKIPDLADSEGAVSDLELDDCSVEPGGQRVSGTITNSATKVRDYVVVISWANENSDVRGRAVVVERGVKPGQERSFRATADVAPGADQCVPNVRAGKMPNRRR